MPDTQASIGYGTTFEMADAATPTDFVYVSEVFNLSLGSEATDQIDATHMQSPGKFREYIDGLTDPGELTFEMNYIPGSDSDRKISAAKGKRKWTRITFPNGCQFLTYASRQNYEPSAPHDDKMTASVTFKRSGEPVLTEPTAPRALVTPAISGTPKVGAPLTLDPGVWAGAKDFAIQWQKDAAGDGNFTNIPDATGMAYVPVTGDVGSEIRATVTGSNSDFSTPVNSTETAAVAA
ncbi:phage tail tube protein [Rhizobium sp. LC145]|uniref:phage tail tube protein n=1 Tax=Rhizobium sp. LC145 TaxID=1120688 RepID=UPI00062A3BA6|nr:phage tail tube protein [Rhizobium sp. LC145]KKX28227.1 histidine kinase [Rhizobium sp. LC145]TKT58353.1 histidine kinase [Rhizobiaceae bacterium LC148]